MNLVFLTYFTLIVWLCFLVKYKWAVVLALLGGVHLFWYAAECRVPAVIFIASNLSLYLIAIYLLYYYQEIRRQELDKIVTVSEGKQKQFEQLTQQEEQLKNDNLTLRQDLHETVAFYDYVKKLGLTLDFEQAVTVLKETLTALTRFSAGRLILIERGKVADAYHVPGIGQEQGKAEDDFDEKIFSVLKDKSEPVLWRQGEAAPFNFLPVDWQPFLAVPLMAEQELVAVLTLANFPPESLEKISFVATQFALEVKKTQLYRRVKDLSIIDGLTCLNLRRHFLRLLAGELDRCYRQRRPLSFLMMDIDFFKRYNDEYGHLVGDLILKTVAVIMMQKSRENDVICRYGGDEFGLALPRTRLVEARVVAERLRREVNAHLFQVAQGKFQVSISIGVAGCLMQEEPDDDAIQRLVDIADSAMYQAKAKGRNCVVVHE